MHFDYPLKSLASTRQLARVLAAYLQRPICCYLCGELGSGKTTFMQHLLAALGIDEVVNSPTFTLVEQYQYQQYTICHADLYRIKSIDELQYLGFDEFTTSNTYFFIEWPEQGAGSLPNPDLQFYFTLSNQGERQVTITAMNVMGQKLLTKVQQCYELG